MAQYPTTDTTQGIAPSEASQRVAAIVGFLLFVELSSGFLQGYYTPLFGSMVDHWEITDATITWFVTAQTLAAGVSVPVLSKLGDIYGHRRILRIAVVLVTLGAALVALSPSFELALLGRVLCGPLAVWLPLEIGIVHSKLTQASSRKAIGLLVGSITLGALLGSIAAGITSAIPNLTIVLLIPVGVLVLCTLAVFLAVPESTERANPKIDGPGFVGLAAFMLLLLWGLHQASSTGFGSPGTLLSLGAAVVIFVGWVWWERRAKVPAIDLSLVTQSTLWPAYLISFVLGMVVLGTQTVLITFLAGDPDVLSYGFALEPGKLSLISIVGIFPATIAAMVFSRLAKRLGLIRVLLIGLSMGMLGQVGLLTLNGSLAAILVCLVIGSLGQGLLLGALPALISEEAPSDATGIATGVYNSLKTLGGAVAGSVFAMVLTAFVVPELGAASRAGYLTIWAICAGAFVLGLLVLPILKRNRPVTTVIPVQPQEVA
ncbi:putative MFS family arabinose efflux permease [Leucobacter luti]|uniref:Putative MFS family arabinose efflux permease n=1 Tax=Leucobacter luti TaxID=340320 RepID=A0A4R6S133_9MICO|nr:MFS transporter [Leucobacter luti]TDP93190.1 putative MFS family arabinose efflux permease [Leucobacter luti]